MFQNQVRFGEVRFGAMRYGSERCGTVRSDAVRFGQVRLIRSDTVIRFAFQTGPNRTGSIEWFVLNALLLLYYGHLFLVPQ